MNTKEAITVGLLVICGVAVFFAISGGTATSLGASDEKAIAQKTNELRDEVYKDTAAECFDMDSAEVWIELERLEKILEEAQHYELKILEQELAQEKATTTHLYLFNLCDLLNILEWLETKDPYLAEQFIEKAEALGIFYKVLDLGLPGFRDENNAKEAGLDYPLWYYHFTGEGANSRILVIYPDQNPEAPVLGKIQFSYYSFPRWYYREIYVLWNLKIPREGSMPPDSFQRFFFSCYLDPRERRGWTPIPMLTRARLRTLSSYWYLDDHYYETKLEAKLTFDAYNFCDWYCANESDQNKCKTSCRNILKLDEWKGEEALGNLSGTAFTEWHRSALLTIVPYPDMRAEEKRSAEYFDDITFYVLEKNEEVKLKQIQVWLNGEQILDLRGNFVIRKDSPLKLKDAIEQKRESYIKQYVSNPPDILIGASHDIGQTWNLQHLVGAEWEFDGAWSPIPGEWCGDFVRGMITLYTDLNPIPGFNELLWDYFGKLNRLYCSGNEYCGKYRISPLDTNPLTGKKYKWIDLATVVKAGYTYSLAEKVQGWEQPDHFHQTIFINWITPPAETGPAKCFASFNVIGGNQNDVVNLDTITICNGSNSNCGCDVFRPIWGANYCSPDFCNFFGRTERWE